MHDFFFALSLVLFERYWFLWMRIYLLIKKPTEYWRWLIDWHEKWCVCAYMYIFFLAMVGKWFGFILKRSRTVLSSTVFLDYCRSCWRSQYIIIYHKFFFSKFSKPFAHCNDVTVRTKHMLPVTRISKIISIFISASSTNQSKKKKSKLI